VALAPGTRVGPFEIMSALGAGGMGEVYRARDPRLGRDVAIKILPADFAGDRERLARFEREARILAALNHPNIATILGIEDDGVRALVMEVVEGPTLADRIRTGPVELQEALAIARQIADALDTAHQKGIVHRDLKPANVKVTPAGSVKVLDFGLAKAVSEDAGPTVAQASVKDAPMTRDGQVMGTAAYMSPEQARGETVDQRTDVWAFGCVLYELLTGHRAFGGVTTGESIAEVLKGEPDWRRLPDRTPESLRRLLERCLRKDPARRLRDIGDARLELDEPQTTAAQPPLASKRRERAAWAVAAVAMVAAVAALLRPVSPSPPLPELRLELTTPPTPDASFAVSPDGRRVVFVAPSEGQKQLWVRALDSLAAQPLRGTERATLPFWAPDNRAIGFFADAQLKRVSLDDGSVRALATGVPNAGGGSWNRNGMILFSPSPGTPIARVSDTGGEPADATRFDPDQRSHMHPVFLPDDRHFLFFVVGPPETRGVQVGQLDDVNSRHLIEADSFAVFAITGHLVFPRAGKLLAQAFDADRLTLNGDPLVIDDRITARTAVSASAAGPLVYSKPPPDALQRQLVWFDRKGQELQKVVYADSGGLGPALSPDGRHIAVYRYTNDNNDIWSYDVDRRTWDRLTVHPGDDIFPLWSWDGKDMVFSSRRGSLDLYERHLDAPTGSEQLLLSTPQPKFATDWSRDRSFLLFNIVMPRRGFDISALPLAGTRTPIEILSTEFNESNGQFSPDGRWIAYQSDRTGRFEIYVRPFPGPGADIPVSTNGGAQPRWNPKGSELFYVAADDQLMAVPVRAGDGSLKLDAPRALFLTNIGNLPESTGRQLYVVTPDGESFVMQSSPDPSSGVPLFVILNWKPRL